MFSPLIGVVGVMADKDYEGVLAAFEPVIAAHRLHPELHRPGDAGRGARRGRARHLRRSTGCTSRRRLEDAIDQAATLAEDGGVFGEAIGSGGVLVTGSVVTVGRGAAPAASPRPGRARDAFGPAVDVRRHPCAAGGGAVPDHAVMISVDRRRGRTALVASGSG